MTAKDIYQRQFADNKNICIFFQPWWLETVCKDSWDVIAYKNEAGIEAYMPIHVLHKYGFTTVRPPVFTPYCGIISNSDREEKLHSKYRAENEICEYFATELDKKNVSACFYNLHPDFFCSTPFIQHGYSANVRYTYLVDISDTVVCFENFSKALRKKLRRCEQNLICQTEGYDLRQLYDISKQVYAKQKASVSYSFETFETIVNNSLRMNQGKMFVIKDKQENVNAFLFVVWDNHICYSLIGGNDQSYLQNNATAYAQYLSMQFAHDMGITCYNTEGSMLKGVEEYFMQFSGVRTPYISLCKYNNAFYMHLRKLLHH